MPDPIKDREATLAIAPGRAEILYCRSTAMPIKYAIMLRLPDSDGRWETVASIDSSHDGRDDVDAHHLHRYAHGEKQAPQPLPFAVDDANEAMNLAIDWFAANCELF